MKKLIFSLAMAACVMSSPTLTAGSYGNNSCDPCCDNSFDGLYVGLNAGVLSHDAHRLDFDGFFGDNSGWSTVDTGFTGGFQLGYDWQCDSLVLGAVADMNFNNLKRTLHNNPGLIGQGHLKSKVDWSSSMRLRLGVPVCDTLIYLTGGAVVSKFETKWYQGGVNDSDFRHSDYRWGWIGGVGIEHKIGCNLSFGAEFLCSHFAHNNKRFTDEVSSLQDTYKFGHSATDYVGRLTLNYRFGDLCNLW